MRRRWDAEKGKWEWWNLCKSLQQQLMMKVCRLISSSQQEEDEGERIDGDQQRGEGGN